MNESFVIYRGASTDLSFALLDERDEVESLTGVTAAKLDFKGASDGDVLLEKDCTFSDVTNRVTVTITAADAILLPLGLLLCDLLLTIGGVQYSTDPMFAKVAVPVTTL